MRGCAASILFALLVVQTVAMAQAGERSAPTAPAAAVSGTTGIAQRAIKAARPSVGTTLDRVAYAVDGAESSHGEDLTMWRPDPDAPQGPMQVSGPAAADVGGGNRFDLAENRAIGRAYLAQLYTRYKNWPDAIAAYNWGMGNLDTWIKAGRPADKFVMGVAAYLRRVLHDSGMCEATATPEPPRRVAAEQGEPEANSFAPALCAELDAQGGMLNGDRSLFGIAGRFHNRLDKAMLLVAQHLPVSPRSSRGR